MKSLWCFKCNQRIDIPDDCSTVYCPRCRTEINLQNHTTNRNENMPKPTKPKKMNVAMFTIITMAICLLVVVILFALKLFSNSEQSAEIVTSAPPAVTDVPGTETEHDEAPEHTDEVPEHTDEVPEHTDEAPEHTDEENIESLPPDDKPQDASPEPDKTAPAEFPNDVTLVKFTENGKIGYRTPTGTVHIPATYDWGDNSFIDGIARVGVNGKYGYIDKSGKIVIDIKYDDIGLFANNGLAVVRIDTGCGYINRNGELKIPLEFDDAWTFEDNGTALVLVDGSYYYIDSNGNRSKTSAQQ